VLRHRQQVKKVLLRVVLRQKVLLLLLLRLPHKYNIMLLKEFIYFDRDHSDLQDDNRYISKNDTVNVLKKSDLRKTRLTLGMINDIRRAAEAHDKEKQKDLVLIKKMYAAPPPDAAAA
jgi:hypothetical protein